MTRLFLDYKMISILTVLLVSPAIGVQPGTASDSNITQLPVTMTQDKITMEFSDMPLDSVLDYLSQATGLIIIKEVDVQGRVSVVSRHPMTLDESIKLLNTLLYQHGYATLRSGRNLTIVSLDEAKQRNIPVRSGADPSAIEPSDEMITQVIPIRYADAEKLQEDIQPLLPDYAQLSANESSNALILTDTAAGVHRVVQIVKELDRTMAAVNDVRVFTLEYAEAESTARLINEVFEVDDQQRQQGGFGNIRSMFMRRMGGRPGGGDNNQQQSSGPSQKITAAADERTNTVVVSGPPEVLDVVESVIDQLDSDPAEQQSVFIYRLENADAESLADTLNELFQDMEQSAVRTNNRQQGRNNQSRGNTNNRQASGASSAATDLAGEVTVVADTDTNSLVVMTSSKNFDRVKEIIADLDHPVPQVLIKVLIAEVTHDNDIDIGVEFSAFNVGDSPAWTLGTDFGLDELTKGFSFSVIDTNVTAAVHALQELGSLDILSRPYILASDNQTARITVGEEFPFIRDTRITETGQTLNTIQYEDIGITLEVTPHINPEGLVIMTVSPEITVESEDTVEITNDVNAAKFVKRAAQTRIAIQNGQTIVIGGLVQDTVDEMVTQVPILGDIPLLGELFKRTEKKKSKTELLIFLTPHVAEEQQQLQQISDAEKQGNTLINQAVEPGKLDEHLRRMEHGSAPPIEGPDIIEAPANREFD